MEELWEKQEGELLGLKGCMYKRKPATIQTIPACALGRGPDMMVEYQTIHQCATCWSHQVHLH